MPTITIEVRNQFSVEKEKALIEAVHAALLISFKVLPTSNIIRLIVHEPHRFACPPTIKNPELYTHVSIDCFTGRSLEAKRSLYTAIVENFEVLGIPKDHVKILLHEINKENCSIRDGLAACDIELGFKINV